MSATVFLIDWLDQRYDQLPAYGQVPKNRPSSFLQVQRLGGKVGRFWDEAYLAVRVWAESMARADELAVRIANDMETSLPYEGEVALADVTGVIPYSGDPENIGVYQISINLTIKLR